MRSSINSLPTFCLLTLIVLTASVLTGCDGNNNESHTHDPSSFEKVDQAHILSHIQEAERPYTLVNFYATWCKPCKVELPELIKLHNAEESKVNVMLVSMDEQEVVEHKLASFLQDMKVDFPSYVAEGDPEGLVRAFVPDWDGYIPLNLVFDQQGNLIESMGMTDQQEVEMIINRNELLNN